jgi:hypothetical protein
MKRLLLFLGLLSLPSVSISGQQVPLNVIAEKTRRAWQRQDVAGLVELSPQLVIQLPDADPSAPVVRQQAMELLKDFFQGSEEIETILSDAREVGGGWGFVDLRRRYRVRGTQEVKEQLLLFSYRLNGTGWTLV